MRIPQLKKDKFITYTVDRKQETMTALQKVYMEIHFMAKLDDPNIIKIYEMIQDDKKDYIYLVTEFCHFGQISDWNEHKGKYIRNQALIDHLKQTELVNEESKSEISEVERVGKIIFKEAMKGLLYLHQKNIVHRDIKPDNIFFSKIGNKAKIGDFTVSQQLPEPEFMLMSKAGTCLFMAPEIEPPEEDDGKYEIFN